MLSAVACFKRTSVLWFLIPRLSVLVLLLRTVRHTKAATNPRRKAITVFVFSWSSFNKPHKYRHHPYRHPICFASMVCALEVGQVLMYLAQSSPTSSEQHVSSTLWTKTWRSSLWIMTSCSVLLPWTPTIRYCGRMECIAKCICLFQYRTMACERERSCHSPALTPPPSGTQPWPHWTAQYLRNWTRELLYILIQDTFTSLFQVKQKKCVVRWFKERMENK